MKNLISCAGSVILLLAPLPALAQNLPPIPAMNPGDSDRFVVWDPTSTSYSLYAVGEVGEANGTYYIQDASLADPTKLGFATGLNESISGPLSDVFGVITLSGGYYLGFNSGDPVNTFYLGNPTTTLLEGADPVPADGYLSPDKRAAGYHLWFQSDIEAPVPDGGLTAAMLGAAMLAMGCLRRKMQ